MHTEYHGAAETQPPRRRPCGHGREGGSETGADPADRVGVRGGGAWPSRLLRRPGLWQLPLGLVACYGALVLLSLRPPSHGHSPGV